MGTTHSIHRSHDCYYYALKKCKEGCNKWTEVLNKCGCRTRSCQGALIAAKTCRQIFITPRTQSASTQVTSSADSGTIEAHSSCIHPRFLLRKALQVSYTQTDLIHNHNGCQNPLLVGLRLASPFLSSALYPHTHTSF